MQGTDLDWFRRLRAATDARNHRRRRHHHARRNPRLQTMNIHAALGMAIYTGRLDLGDLARLASPASLAPQAPMLA